MIETSLLELSQKGLWDGKQGHPNLFEIAETLIDPVIKRIPGPLEAHCGIAGTFWPFLTVALIAAIVLLLCTVLQVPFHGVVRSLTVRGESR